MRYVSESIERWSSELDRYVIDWGRYYETTNGKYFFVSECDYDLAKSYKWYSWSYDGVHFYIRRNPDKAYFHRVALQPEQDQVVDHINGDGCDNSRLNIRICTPGENTYNRLHQITSKTGIKGVCWDSARNKWRAQLSMGGRKYLNRRFNDIDAAIAAYREATKEYHKEYGRYT